MPEIEDGYTEGVEDGLASGSVTSKSMLNVVGGNRLGTVVESDSPLPPEIGEGAGDDVIPGDATGVTPATTAMLAAIGASPQGSYVTSGKTNARFLQGSYKVGLMNVHPSVSLNMNSRGGTILVPADNLPATDPLTGQESAILSLYRTTPDSNLTIAWAPRYSGFNIDGRTTTFTNPVDAIFTPNPKNYPDYNGNKDYVAGALAYMDIIGMSGNGWSVQAGNGRADIFSARALNNDLVGFDMGGNDIVMSGHWAVGGNGLFGLKVGLAAGFFATCGNLWSQSSARALTVGAMWMNQRKMFSMNSSEFNDWLRVDGGVSYWRGGNFANLVFAHFAANFVSDGLAIDMTSGGPDSRLQSNIGTIEYQTVNYLGISHLRTDPVGNSAIFTVTIGAGAVFTATKHGLTNGTRVCLQTNGALPTGLSPMTWYFVVGATTNTFQLSLTSGGAAITTSGTQSGTHQFGDTLTASNIGGDLLGNFGTAMQFAHNVGGSGNQPASINIIESHSSAPNCKGWTGPNTTVTMSIASPGVCTAPGPHGLIAGYQIAFATTGALPTGLVMGTRYYIATVPTTSTFTVSLTKFGSAIAFTGSQSGIHTVFWIASTPFSTHNGATTNYFYQDSYLGLTRIGTQGATHSHMAFGLAEIDEPNFDYAVEIGDRTVNAGQLYRNALYGQWEFQSVISYGVTAYDRRTTASGSITIPAGRAEQFLSTAGGGIAAYAITLPQGMTASYRLPIVFVGGAIAALTWTATVATNSPPLPAATNGYLALDLLYSPDNDSWAMIDATLYGTPSAITAAATGAQGANWAVATAYEYTLTGNITLNNPSNAQDGQEATYILTQDATGGRTVSYAAKILRPGGTSPTLTTTAGAVNVLKLRYCKSKDVFFLTLLGAGYA